MNTIWKWIVDNILSKLNQVHFFQVCLFLFILFCLYVIVNYFWCVFKKRQKSGPIKEKTKKDRPKEEIAHLYYFYCNDNSVHKKPRFKGFYSAETPDPLKPRKEKTLFISFDGKDWFFFKEPRILQKYQVALFDKIKGDLRKGRILTFNWMGQSMKILHCARYDVETKGNYPHFIHRKNQVSLLLAKKNEAEIVEESWGEFCLIEEIRPIEVTTWQTRTNRIWTGGPLSKEEFLQVRPNYSDPETEEVHLDTKVK